MQNLHKYIITASVASTLLFSAGFIHAQNTRLEELRKQADQRAQKANEQIQKHRDEAQAKIKDRRDDLREKIGRIKDEKKQEAASKIANQMEHINQVWTNHFVNVLDRLDAVLQKIKSRTEKAVANGTDVSSVNTAIAGAETAIASARTAVAAQAQKTYVVDMTSVTQDTSTTAGQNSLMGELRKKFKDLRDQLFGDLTALRDGAMKDARTAVHDVLKTLSQLPNVDKEPSGNSPN